MAVTSIAKSSDHPAESLSKLVPEDIKNQLLKTPKFLMIEHQNHASTLSSLRNNFKYSFVVQWIYLLKHVIKLADAFDVENFEEELLGIAPPTFLNSLKSKLILFLKNQKIVSIDMEFDFFVDQIYKDYNLLELNGLEPENAGGHDDNGNENKDGANYLNDNDGDGDGDDDDDDSPVITYSKLPLSEKIDVLYNLIKLANTKSYSNFRKTVDKFEKPQFDLKITPIYETVKGNTKEEYIILQDARVYRRKWEFSKLEIPVEKSEYNEKVKNPYTDLAKLSPKLVEWTCLTTGIYQYDNYIKDLRKSFGKKTSSDEYALSQALEANIDFIIQHDLKKRKQSAQRKREIEMQMLMANRKRSSRLEEKERRKKEEEAVRMKELEVLKQQAAEMRAAKRQKLKESMYSTNNDGEINTALSREERLRKRHETTPLDNSEQDGAENHRGNGEINTESNADSSLVEIQDPNVQESPQQNESIKDTSSSETPALADNPTQTTQLIPQSTNSIGSIQNDKVLGGADTETKRTNNDYTLSPRST